MSKPRPPNLGDFLPHDPRSLFARLRPTPGFSCNFEGCTLWDFPTRLHSRSLERQRSGDGSTTDALLVHPSGLECAVRYESFSDTGVMELDGRIVHRGRRALADFRGPFSLALRFDLGSAQCLRVAWLDGGALTDGCYPPPAYRFHEADLPPTGVLNLMGGRESGRSTDTQMPYLFVLDTVTERGFFVALEWPCRWIIGIGFDKAVGPARLLTLYAHPGWTQFRLKPGEEVPLPKVLLGTFQGGFDEGGNLLRRHVVHHVRRPLADVEDVPPVFYNSFYEVGSDLRRSDLKRQVDVHAELGAEYFVADAGWFEGAFRAGIGNWERTDRAKFPRGMEELARYVESRGMRFGAWLEIEFAMRNSDWGRRHRDWFRAAGDRQNAFYARPRYEDLLLRLEDPAVRASVADFLESWVCENRIQWLRWDFNNGPLAFWESHETARETGRLHLGYGQGLYALLDEFMRRCPRVHLEACAGGGHRMDLGTLRRAHSAWMNDNSTTYPAVRRMQAGLNRILPGCYANSCFHWATPSARNDRALAASFRRNGYPPAILRSRMAGSLGFAEDSRLWSPRTRAWLRDEVSRYKAIRHLLMADYFPLFNPAGLGEYDGWQFHDPKTGEAMVMIFRCESPDPQVEVNLAGLEPGAGYRIRDVDNGRSIRHRGGQPLKVRVTEANGTRWLRCCPE